MTNPAPSSVPTLIEYIRFQLDQLNARNAQHEFEHLCRHFARETIAPNLLPATGPVGSGGDQGKDFETFTTFIAKKKSESAFFVGVGESKPLVFACSLHKQKGLKGKIEADVREICAAGLPHIIYFISNQNVPVSLRHSLQEWCGTYFTVRLEIIDGQALAEQLSQPRVFWVAEQFLQVPAEMFPHSVTKNDSRYDEVRKKWLETENVPFNFADFVEIKQGLRQATFNDDEKVDLPRWIALMERFLGRESQEELRRRATYEICVAALRGQHDLTARKSLVESYFEFWGTPTEPVQLRDATILLSYCSSALMLGEFEIDSALLHTWSKRLVKSLESAISKAAGPNSLAELLATRAHAAHLVFLKSEKPQRDTDDLFRWWFRLVAAARKAPLFPVEDFADLLTVLTPHIGKDSRFEKLKQSVDSLLETRSKGYLVAEKSRDRAAEYLKDGQLLAAIDELHRAKVRWFTGDTLKGTILALLTLSDAYLKLGLIYAAKYHALGAAFLAFRSDDEDIKSYITDGLYQLCECEYAGGEWIAYSEHFPIFLVAHYQHESAPDDWLNHGMVKGAVFNFLVARSLARALGSNAAADLVEAHLRSLSMPEEVRNEILDPPLPLEAYESMSAKEIMARTSEEIWAPPFADCGPVRVYRWRALGISWSASCSNTLVDVPYVEGFIAVLQIAIADLGRVDLCLLPTSVELDVSVHDEKGFRVKENPDNKKLAFKILVPRSNATDLKHLRESEGEVLAVANMLLIWCSCLPDAKVKKILESAYKNELTAKAFLVRPYWELYLDLTPRKDFNVRRKNAIGNLGDHTFNLREHKELAWNDTPGIGYTKAKAREFLQNRYRRGVMPIRKTLDRLRHSTRFQQWVRGLREEGMLDWQILLTVTNTVLNYRIKLRSSVFNPAIFKSLGNELINREEVDSDPEFPEDVLYAKETEIYRQANVGANASTWGLVIRRETPDLAAVKKLLDVRFFQATNDIPHDDLFSPL